jgi:hypothetical protein
LTSSELQKRQPGLPSWVPDWSLNSKTSRLGWSFFSASRGSSAELRFGSGFSTLNAMSIFIDTLDNVSSPWNLHQSKGTKAKNVEAAAKSFLLEIKCLTRLESQQNTRHHNIAKAVWSTSIAGLELADDGK